MIILLLCMSVHNVWLWCSCRTEESVRGLESGATDSCEPPYGYWEPLSGPLKWK